MKSTRISGSIMIAAALCFPFVDSVARAQCDPEETAKLLASDGEQYDLFGSSLAVDGDVAVVGAWAVGSVYFFRWNGTSWIEEQRSFVSGIRFGWSVALDGDIAIIGANWDSNGGLAYVFRFDGSEWVEEQILVSSDREQGDHFGHSVAVKEDIAVVGATRAHNGKISSAYVFRYAGSEWVEEQILRASDGSAGDWFGQSVSISGNTIVVGAYGDDDRGTDSGSAYIYRFIGSSWIEEQKLLASDGEMSDYFGCSVAVSGDNAVVGAKEDDDLGADSGSAYVFRFDGSSWVDEQKLIASVGQAGDHFGCSAVLSGDVIVVGADLDDDVGDNSGSAYIFEKVGSVWTESAKLLASDGWAGDWFGRSVSISGSTIFVGSYGDDDRGTNSGSAYVFDLNCGDGPTLSVLGSCPGAMRFSVQGATPNERVAYLYARGEGRLRIPEGNPCAGTTLGLNNTAQLADVVRANANGTANLDIPNVPNAACGHVFVQAIDLTTCATTDVLLVQ